MEFFPKKKKADLQATTEVQESNIGEVPTPLPLPPPEKEKQGYEAEDFGNIAFFMAEFSNINLIIVAELRAMRQELAAIKATLEAIQRGG